MTMTMVACLVFAPSETPGWSETAQFLQSQNKELQHVFDKCGHSPKSELFSKLFELSERCSAPGWAGYDSNSIAPETYRNAYSFIEALPLNIRLPQIEPEPDGHIAFEWYVSPKRLISVSISPEGDLHYACISGARKIVGSEPLLGQISNELATLIVGIEDAWSLDHHQHLL